MTDSAPSSSAGKLKVNPQAIADEILRQTIARGPASSICPTEVARALGDPQTWQRLLPPIRRQAAKLADDGKIDILRKGKALPVPIGQDSMRGVLRLRIRIAGENEQHTPEQPPSEPSEEVS